MAIRYFPHLIGEKVFSPRKARRLVSQRLSVNRAALSAVVTEFFPKKKVLDVALKVVKQYKARVEEEMKSGATRTEAVEDTLDGRKLLLQRVRNAASYEHAELVRQQYRGQKYIWLPSAAEEPDPLHQANYGLTFTIGNGEMPGERYGCQCGMEILTDDDELELEE